MSSRASDNECGDPHSALTGWPRFARHDLQISSSQLQLDAALDSFASQSTDIFSIASMTAAGLVGKLARLGILSAFSRISASGVPLQIFISHLGSVAAEAATITGINLGQGRGPAHTEEFFKNFINFGGFRLFHISTQNSVVQHFVQSAALMAGHQISASLGLEEVSQKSFAEQFFDANLTTLQISVGGRLSAEITGGKLQNLERNLENISHHTSHVSPLFTHRFSIFQAASAEGSLPHTVLEARLQEAYRTSPLEAVQVQRITECICFILRLNPAHSASGSFKNALLQRAIEGAARIEDPSQRITAFQNIFSKMTRGSSYSSLVALNLQYASPPFQCRAIPQFSSEFSSRYLGSIPRSGPHSWEAFGLRHSTLLLNYIEHVAGTNPERVRRLIQLYGEANYRYPQDLIRSVLENALHSPIGERILERFTYILVTQDVAAKLHELRDLSSMRVDESIPTSQLVYEMSMRGMKLEKIAMALNGSIHTAYLDDMRIARKVTSFYRDLENGKNLPQKRIKAKQHIVKTFRNLILPRWQQGSNFTVQDLTDLLESNPSAITQEFMGAHRRGEFEIQIAEGAEFDRIVASWGKANNCTYSYFIQKPAPEKAVLLIRHFNPSEHLQDPSDCIHQIVFRLHYMIHEWEHWRHFTGHFGKDEQGGTPYLASMDRGNRMGSEMLAYLEEHRWLTLHWGDEVYEYARLLGDPFIVHLRTLGDVTYYTKVNNQLAREIIP